MGAVLLKDGYKKRLVIMRSMILVSTGVLDIGLKSECCVGTATVGTGRIDAVFHWIGTWEVARDRLKRRASGSLKTEAPTLRNHCRLVFYPFPWPLDAGGLGPEKLATRKYTAAAGGE